MLQNAIMKRCIIIITAITLIYPAIIYSENQHESEQIALTSSAKRTDDANNLASGLYDEKILRTIYLQFNQSNWWNRLNRVTDIPADLTVDGVTYSTVGIRFKGLTSYYTGTSKKKSFNISIDYGYPDQRLMSYKTLNLHNCYQDPSFMREVLFCNVCQDYIPCPKANFVKLVINGENWGIYANVQQVNADMIEEWFPGSNGDRWKVVLWDDNAQPSGSIPPDDGALTYLGNDSTPYKQQFELKSAHSPDPWKNLINACYILNTTPLAQLENTLNTIMDVDRWLWFLVLENVFTDDDGYYVKGADYGLYYEVESGRLHPLEYDANSTFMSRSIQLNPVSGETDAKRPVISKLLSISALRQRYFAHMRTVIKEWFDWNILGSKVALYRSLIENEVKADSKKLFSYNRFISSLTDIENFVKLRRGYLLSYPQLNKTVPEISSVIRKAAQAGGANSPVAGQSVQITARIGGNIGIAKVILYYAKGAGGLFSRVIMLDDGLHGDDGVNDGIFGGEIPDFPAGNRIFYYVEARAYDATGTTVFAPPGAEHDVFSYTISLPIADTTPVVINEIMASNQTTVQDPQGEYDDWVELLNISSQAVDLSGMYVSDTENNPKKWPFPRGTTIAPGAFLIIWADEDGRAEPGLHANFKLSGNGEVIMLVDTDDRANALLDSVVFGAQKTDISIGRCPDGVGEFGIMSKPTPAIANQYITAISDNNSNDQPQEFRLEQNYPNPFNPQTTIRYDIPIAGRVELVIYNILGQEIKTLINEYKSPGNYEVVWNGVNKQGQSASSGIYLYKLRAREHIKTKKMVLLK